ncbi:MAG: hypothetical protein CMD16_03805 [Flavobacteriales bacterium]|nr:hypothetical protein [Flavobacteriales bacterium]|tara:strand:- start:10130 stop:11266 length:1137 start_codon:yes stop_codon:yes gene_type:complete
MLRWLFKYAAAVFIFNTILLSIEVTMKIGNLIFFGLMALYSIALLINPNQMRKIIFHKSFYFLLIINILNIIYFFLFHSIADIEAVKYLLARAVKFAIISGSIYFHLDYYKIKFLDHIIYLTLFIISISLILDPNIFIGRYSGIIWNPNMLSSLVTISFAILFLKYKNYDKVNIFLLILFLAISLATGSRGSLVGILLVFLFKYSFSRRNIFYAILAIAAIFIISNIQLSTSINRFSDQSLFNDRILQYEYAFKSIYSKLYTGYGLDKYSYIDKSLVPIFLKGKIIGAHNAYLAILTQYGIVFGSLVLYIIFQKSYSAILFFRNSSGNEKVYLFIIIYTLIASIYETLITGVNEFQTSLFWFSLAILSYSKYKIENAN